MSNTQWHRIAEHFREGIESGKLKPGERLPSDARLAEEWGVSRPTAHRALHELQRLGFVLRSRMGTVVAGPVAKATGRYAFIVDRFVPMYNFPQQDLIRGIQHGLGEESQLMIATCDSDPAREARELERFRGQVDGIVIYPTTNPETNALLQQLHDDGTPLVVLDRLPPGLRVDAVTSDNVGATAEAVQLLVDRGHRRIGFFSFHKPEFSSVNERHTAYHEALLSAGVDDTGLTRWFSPALESSERLLLQSLQDALYSLRAQSGITALFCVEDHIASYAMQAAAELGIRVPEDLEVATFNDWPPAMLRNSWCIHRIVQRAYDIGHAAALLLTEQRQSRPSEPRLVRVPAELFAAQSRDLPGVLGGHDLTHQTNGG